MKFYRKILEKYAAYNAVITVFIYMILENLDELWSFNMFPNLVI